MEVKIIVDEKMFSGVIGKELKSIPKEELQKIVAEGIIKCLSNVKTLEEILQDKYGNFYYAKDIIKDAFKKIDLSPCFKDLQDKVIDYINTNQSKLVREAFLQFIISSLTNALYNSGDFQNRLRTSLYNLLAER